MLIHSKISIFLCKWIVPYIYRPFWCTMHLFCFQLTDNENLNPFLAQWTTSATNDSKSIPKFSYLPKCAIDTFKISPAKYHEYLRFTVYRETNALFTSNFPAYDISRFCLAVNNMKSPGFANPVFRNWMPYIQNEVLKRIYITRFWSNENDKIANLYLTCAREF